MAAGQDSEFSEELFTGRYNSELANDFGNSVARLLNMGARYAGGKVPAALLSSGVDEEPERTLRAEWERLAPEIGPLCDDFQFHTVIERINGFVKAINRYLDIRSPWKLAKSPEAADQAKVATSLAYLAEGVRLAAVAYAPFMPGISARVLGLLGQKPVERWEGQLVWDNRLAGAALGEKEILFPKIESAEKAEAKG
jgi:methionyl-tRNA synthetase